MNFPSQTFFNNINHGYRAAILQKISLWLLSFYVAVATYCYYEKVQFYDTSFTRKFQKQLSNLLQVQDEKV